MNRAIALAGRVDLQHDANPRVGAVVVSADGEVVGEGWHEGSGTAHAEVVALTQAGKRAKGATVYSTLEPCAAAGRVGACVAALLAAEVSSVIFGQTDPNPVMAGGAQQLAAAGVAVRGGDLAAECAALNPSWTFAHDYGRPWVVWKTATSLDGFVATANGTSKWLTGPPARAMVQELRAHVGAVVTGTGTVLADNPRLTVRTAVRQPLRIVVGNRELPPGALVHPVAQYRMPIGDALAAVWQDHGCHRVLVEAGPGLSSALWQAGLVDEVYWFQAPVVLGTGIRGLAGSDGLALGDVRRFSEVAVNRVGLDLLYHFLTR